MKARKDAWGHLSAEMRGGFHRLWLVQPAARVQTGRWQCQHRAQQRCTGKRAQRQLRELALLTGGKHLLSFTKTAVMTCVGALWPPPGRSAAALAERRSAVAWQGTVKNSVELNMSLCQRQLTGQLEETAVCVISSSGV